MTFEITTTAAATRTDTETFLVEHESDGDDEDDNDRSIRWTFLKWLHEDLSWDELRSIVLHMHRDEYELLREMVRMQSPLPIPTHPRAIPFLPASTWGRNYYDRRDKPTHRHCHLWQQKCRMLQVLPKDSSVGTRNGSSMDDQEAALLAMLMHGNSNNNSNRIRHKVPFRDKQKKLREEKKKTRAENQKVIASAHDVIARQFKSLESLDLYNSNSLYQQQRADWNFLNSITMEPTDDANIYYCGFVESLDENGTNCDPKDLFLQQLKIVTRGNFGSCPLTKTSSPNDHTRLFPDWFDPEERWFTVSMYLACRLEVTLWDAYHQQNLQHCSRKPSILFNPELRHGHPDIMISLLVNAIRDAIKSALEDDRSLYLGNTSHNPFQIRDSLLWYLLRHSTRFAHQWPRCRQIAAQTLTSNMLACPILELGMRLESFVRLIRGRMQLLVSDYVVQTLVHDQMESDDTSVTNNTTAMQTKKKSRRKKKENRKKKNRRTSDSAEIKVDHNTEDASSRASMQTVTKSPSSSEESEMDTSSSNNYFSKSCFPTNHYAFPDNNTSARDRNRNIVMVLSILDDVVAKTFDLFGFNDLPKSKDYVTGGLGGDRHDQEFRLVQCGGKSNESVKKPSSIPLKLSNGSTHTVKALKLVAKDVAPTMKPSSKHTSTSETMRIPKAASSASPTAEATFLSTREPHADWTFDVNDHTLFPSLHVNDNMGMESESFLSSLAPHGTHEAENSATLRTSNLDGLSSSYPAIDPALFLRPDTFASSGWDMPGYSPVDGWGRFRGFPARDESIFTDFFRKQDQSCCTQAGVVIASSTAASIASSTDEIESDPDRPIDVELNLVIDGTAVENDQSTIASSFHDCQRDIVPPEVKFEIEESELATPVSRKDGSESGSGFQSPSPPSTPSPRLSPILVSLSDLSAMRKEAIDNIGMPSTRAISSEPSSNILIVPQKPMLGSRDTSSSSKDNQTTAPPENSQEKVDQEKAQSPKRFFDPALTYKAAASRPLRSSDDHDLRTKLGTRKSMGASSSLQNVSARRDSKVSKDDHDIHHLAREQVTFTPSYKSMLAKAAQTQTGRFSFLDSASKSLNLLHFDAVLRNKAKDGNLCTRSETALDGNDDSQRWSEMRPSKTTDDDNCTMAKDGSTTITSASSRKEPEELILLKEERNAYRDACLTLGAEVAKLKNLLATTSNHALQSSAQRTAGYGTHIFGGNTVFDPDAVNNPFQQAPRAMTLAAMSDTGYRGEHESQASEDEIGMKMTSAGELLSSGVTVAESDASVEIANSRAVIHIPHGLRPVRDINDLVSMNGLQSRLARDIFQFLETTNNQLKKLESKRRIAVQRMTRLVNTIWPRAQVKLYGSHVTGLCLPSSDLDFVVCLPAVHKNAVADAPGDLEGRNAINESSQKLLARRLKGESWIDPRSLKLIERTVVPIIKVSTKDTKAKTLHLDISFDAPHHHGLEAAHMISQVIDELPMIRPLVIVLKQFLLDRGLLTAYTGGLSSYCLFLMVARFLQEQTMMIDCGSLLMSFLDFYGNYFDPRSTGISVLHRQYFPRPNYSVQGHNGRSHAWGSISQMQARKPSSLNHQSSFLRRNSFSDKGNNILICPRNQSANPQSAFHPTMTQQGYTMPNAPLDTETSFDHAMPFTFDPLFVEDPLAEGNNVGRNAFRIVQVQRCFSDAHRALSSALEWDMHSLNETQDANEFHFLKCLLQSEDVVLDL